MSTTTPLSTSHTVQPISSLPPVDLTPLSVAGLKRLLQPGTRYHLTHRVNSAGAVNFRSDHLPGREVIKVQSAQVQSRVIGGESTWLTFPVFRKGDALHATPNGFQFFLVGNGNTLRFAWGDAPEGAAVNRPAAEAQPKSSGTD